MTLNEEEIDVLINCISTIAYAYVQDRNDNSDYAGMVVRNAKDEVKEILEKTFL